MMKYTLLNSIQSAYKRKDFEDLLKKIILQGCINCQTTGILTKQK
jgi:hypothetical protein